MESKKDYNEMIDRLKEKFKSVDDKIDKDAIIKALEDKKKLLKTVVNK